VTALEARILLADDRRGLGTGGAWSWMHVPQGDATRSTALWPWQAPIRSALQTQVGTEHKRQRQNVQRVEHDQQEKLPK
jgi:hypothetical protein